MALTINIVECTFQQFSLSHILTCSRSAPLALTPAMAAEMIVHIVEHKYQTSACRRASTLIEHRNPPQHVVGCVEADATERMTSAKRDARLWTSYYVVWGFDPVM